MQQQNAYQMERAGCAVGILKKMDHGDQLGVDMKLHAEFNSISEMVSFGKFVGNDLVVPSEKPKKDKNLPPFANSWEHAYRTTEANLQRAYERIREFEYIKKNNLVISAEYRKLNLEERYNQENITVLQLTARPLNCLKTENINTIPDLLNCGLNDLLKIPNMGNKSIKEIKVALASRGLKLKGEK